MDKKIFSSHCIFIRTFVKQSTGKVKVQCKAPNSVYSAIPIIASLNFENPKPHAIRNLDRYRTFIRNATYHSTYPRRSILIMPKHFTSCNTNSVLWYPFLYVRSSGWLHAAKPLSEKQVVLQLLKQFPVSCVTGNSWPHINDTWLKPDDPVHIIIPSASRFFQLGSFHNVFWLNFYLQISYFPHVPECGSDLSGIILRNFERRWHVS
jgi:hypothetical protein